MYSGETEHTLVTFRYWDLRNGVNVPHLGGIAMATLWSALY